VVKAQLHSFLLFEATFVQVLSSQVVQAAQNLQRNKYDAAAAAGLYLVLPQQQHP